MLWTAALFLLAFAQQMRIDATCDDCATFYQAWYDLTALLALGALTVLVIRFLRGSAGDAAPNRPQRLGAVATAAGGYVLARLFGHWEVLPDWIDAYGPFVALKGLVLSSDAYTWLTVGHLILCCGAAAWPRRPDPRAGLLDPAVLPPVDGSPPHGWGADVLAAAYYAGRVVSLAVASVMLLGALMQGLRIALSGAPAPSPVGLVFSALVGALSLAAYWTNPHRRLVIGGRPIRLTSLVYSVEFVVLLVVALAMLFQWRLAGTAATWAEQVALGQAVKTNPDLFLGSPGAVSAALAGFLPVAVLTTLAVSVLTVLRIWGAGIVALEPASRP